MYMGRCSFLSFMCDEGRVMQDVLCCEWLVWWLRRRALKREGDHRSAGELIHDGWVDLLNCWECECCWLALAIFCGGIDDGQG